MNSSFTIILLTYNESANLPDCLASLTGVQAPVFAVDSFSTDNTLEILSEHGIRYVQHPFENYARQRNWAQANNPYKTDWVFHLDAGERFTPELVEWLNHRFQPTADTNGYMFSRRTMVFGKWIKHGGHYPNFHLRLYKADQGACEDKAYDQHFVVKGATQVVSAGVDIIDTVMDSWQAFSLGHTRWAVFEAIEILAASEDKGEVVPQFFGTPIERRRWLKNNLFQKSPLFLRAFLYFFYRYIIRLGFLDGSTGLAFHLLQGFWFRFLIDAIVLELRTKMQQHNMSLQELVQQEYGEKYAKLVEK